jgi:hypothetical protein
VLGGLAARRDIQRVLLWGFSLEDTAMCVALVKAVAMRWWPKW